LQSPAGLSLTFYRDAKLIGFGLKHATSGRLTYIVEGKSYGSRQSQRITIGPSHAVPPLKARLTALEVLRRIRSGEHIAAARRAEKRAAELESLSVERAFEEMLDKKRLDRSGELVLAYKPETIRSYRTTFKRLGELRRTQIAKLRTQDIVKVLRDLERKHHHRATPIKAKRLLGAVVSFAIAEHHLEIPNPVRSLPGIVAAPRPRTRRIAVARLAEWFQRIVFLGRHNLTHRDVVLWQLLHGMRPGEAARLRWEQVDLKAGVWKVEDTKNRTDHSLPMTTWSKAMLLHRRQLVPDNHPYVFPGRPRGRRVREGVEGQGFVRNIRSSVQKEFGESPDWSLHDIRRSVRSYLQDGVGIPKERIDRIQNWIDGKRTMSEMYYGAEMEVIQADLSKYHAWLNKHAYQGDHWWVEGQPTYVSGLRISGADDAWEALHCHQLRDIDREIQPDELDIVFLVPNEQVS
jgi:integrase